MYYVRKLSNNPNLEKVKCVDDIGELGADILKQEFGTTNNSLSFWKCESLEKMSDTFKAILLSTTGIKTSQFFVLSEEIIDKYGFKMDDTQLGVTGYKGFEQLHINMIELTYSKIGTVLQMLNEVFKDPQNTPKLNRDIVKAYIMEVKQAGLLNEDVLNDELRKDIDKYCNK